MSGRTDDRRAVDGAEATLARDIEKTWRAWMAFVAEKRDELAASQFDEAPEADLTGMGRAAPRKAKIDPATRQQFGAVLESRRQQAQAKAEKEAREQGRPAPDADQVYGALLQHMLNELNGTVHPSGMALVWYKDALIKFDANAVMAGTTEADYLAHGAGNGPTKQQAALVLGVIVVLFIGLVVMVQWMFGEPPVAAKGAATVARVSNQDAPLWTVSDASLAGSRVPVVVSGSYPLTLCVDASAAKKLAPGATILLTGTTAIRRYQVQPDNAGDDLQLADCGANTTLGGARLTETRTRQVLETATLKSVVVRGPDLDPQAIPPDQMEITLTVALPDVGGGTLVLADGRRWAATTSAAVPGGTRLTYLVPLARTGQMAGWELERREHLPALVPIELPAPQTRSAVLRRLLNVQAGMPTIAIRDGVAEIALDLTVTLAGDAAPLTLLPIDMSGMSDGAAVEVRWEPPTLQPGKAQRMSLRVPIRERRMIELALANWRARLTTE